jgi:hypothetical protein
MSVTSEYFDSANFDVAGFFNQPLSSMSPKLPGASWVTYQSFNLKTMI